MPLLQILKKAPEPTAVGLRAVESRCEFCSAGIDEAHGHLVDLARRTLLCVCRPCYLLFTHDGTGGKRFRAVPERYTVLADALVPREGWDALQIPVGLAFFFQSSATGRATVFYPSPGGATESELPLGDWEALVRAMPALASLRPDVEALLVRRSGGRADALIAPIDACYELVGRIRLAWEGLSGGDAVPREVDAFFARAIERAGSVG